MEGQKSLSQRGKGFVFNFCCCTNTCFSICAITKLNILVDLVLANVQSGVGETYLTSSVLYILARSSEMLVSDRIEICVKELHSQKKQLLIWSLKRFFLA